MNVVLIGMPGSGKSKLGKAISRELGREYIDTDKTIEEKYGSISEIFEKSGEEFFRKIETEAVKEAALKDDAVISTGGGVILKPENMDALKQSGVIIYLKAGEETVFRRTVKSDRPLIKGDREKVKNLLTAREPLYEKYADYVINADCDDIDGKTNQVIEYISTRG